MLGAATAASFDYPNGESPIRGAISQTLSRPGPSDIENIELRARCGAMRSSAASCTLELMSCSLRDAAPIFPSSIHNNHRIVGRHPTLDCFSSFLNNYSCTRFLLLSVFPDPTIIYILPVLRSIDQSISKIQTNTNLLAPCAHHQSPFVKFSSFSLITR